MTNAIKKFDESMEDLNKLLVLEMMKSDNSESLVTAIHFMRFMEASKELVDKQTEVLARLDMIAGKCEEFLKEKGH